MQIRSFRSQPDPAAIAQPRRGFVTWMGLNALIALLTIYLFGLGGIEGNPMPVAIQDQVGGAMVLMAKLVLAMMAGAALWKYGRASLFRIANRLMAVVVVYNLGLATYIARLPVSSPHAFACIPSPFT
jgi:hypothetical protein